LIALKLNLALLDGATATNTVLQFFQQCLDFSVTELQPPNHGHSLSSLAAPCRLHPNNLLGTGGASRGWFWSLEAFTAAEFSPATFRHGTLDRSSQSCPRLRASPCAAVKSLGLVIRDLINNIHQSRHILRVDDETRIEIFGIDVSLGQGGIDDVDGQVVDKADDVIASIYWFAEFCESFVDRAIVILCILLGLVCLPLKLEVGGDLKPALLCLSQVGLIDFSCSAQDFL
jgi:hypothetical protein